MTSRPKTGKSVAFFYSVVQNIREKRSLLQAFEDTIQVNVSRKSSGDPLECSSANYEDSRKASKPVDEFLKKFCTIGSG